MWDLGGDQKEQGSWEGGPEKKGVATAIKSANKTLEGGLQYFLAERKSFLSVMAWRWAVKISTQASTSRKHPYSFNLPLRRHNLYGYLTGWFVASFETEDKGTRGFKLTIIRLWSQSWNFCLAHSFTAVSEHCVSEHCSGLNPNPVARWEGWLDRCRWKEIREVRGWSVGLSFQLGISSCPGPRGLAR